MWPCRIEKSESIMLGAEQYCVLCRAKASYLDETLHAARSVDVQRRIDHELAHCRQLPSKKPIQKYDLRAPFLAAHLEKHLEDVVAEGILHELAQTALQLLEDLRHRGGASSQQDLLQGAAAVVVLGHLHHMAAQAFELD